MFDCSPHSFLLTLLGLLGGGALVCASSLWLGTRFIRENEAGLVIKRFGRALPPGG